MPIYEYACGACNHRFETLQKMSEDPLKQCPACNQAALKKLVSAPNFELKGTGWYETDFKNQKKPESVKTKDNPSADSNQGSNDTAVSSENNSDDKKTGANEKTTTTSTAPD